MIAEPPARLPAQPKSLVALAAVVLVVQGILYALVLPLSALGTTQSFWFLDHPLHLYEIEMGRQLLAHGKLIGYDPFFAGGYLGGVTFNLSSRLPVLLSALAHGVDTRTLYTFYRYACAVVAPVSLVVLAAQMRWTFAKSIAVATIGLAFWWCGAMRWYESAGIVSFVCLSYLALPYAVWCWRLCAVDTPYVAAKLGFAGLVGGLALWFHPLFPALVVFVFAGLMAVWRWGPRFVPFVARGSVVAVVALLFASPWMIAMQSAPTLLGEHPYLREVGLKPLFGVELGMPNGILTPMYLLAATLCVVGALRRPRLFWQSPFVIAGLLMLAFSGWGGLVNAIGLSQPNRFTAPGFLMLCIAGTLAAVEGIDDVLRDGATWLKVLAGTACLFVVVVIGREWVREVEPGPHGHYGKGPPEMSETPPAVQHILDWVANNTTTDGRVLFETSNGRIHAKAHIAPMVSYLTGRELMGAPYPFMQKRQSFYDHVGFGKPYSELGVAELRRGFDLYNIGWIVAWSPELTKLLASAPFVHEAARFDSVVAYVVERPLSYAASGEARVVGRGFDHVDIVGPAQPELVLRYNWVPGLHTCPAARIEPAVVEPDFPPMIRVIDPPQEFTLSHDVDCAH